jgi:hypothetical protein
MQIFKVLRSYGFLVLSWVLGACVPTTKIGSLFGHIDQINEMQIFCKEKAN